MLAALAASAPAGAPLLAFYNAHNEDNLVGATQATIAFARDNFNGFIDVNGQSILAHPCTRCTVGAGGALRPCLAQAAVLMHPTCPPVAWYNGALATQRAPLPHVLCRTMQGLHTPQTTV